MKKLTCLLLCVFLIGITSSAQENVENDYVQIKNAVLECIAQKQYQQAVACIDAYAYTVQENQTFYADLMHDRQEILYIIREGSFVQTKQMVLTLVLNKRYELCLVYLQEQIPLYADCPRYVEDLNKDVQAVSEVFYSIEAQKILETAQQNAQQGKWAEQVAFLNQEMPTLDNPYGKAYLPALKNMLEKAEAMLARAKFEGEFEGDGVCLIAETDAVGTVIRHLVIKKDAAQIILADENTSAIYTEPDSNLMACGAYLDGLKNSGYIFAYVENNILYLSVTADAYGGINVAGEYVLYRK